jgi:hypothetical protein
VYAGPPAFTRIGVNDVWHCTVVVALDCTGLLLVAEAVAVFE